MDNSGHLGCDIQRDAGLMSYCISGWGVCGEREWICLTWTSSTFC